jgi:hypothetical protein
MCAKGRVERTQLDNVSNSTHDHQANSNSLAEAQVFRLIGYNTLVNRSGVVQSILFVRLVQRRMN